MVEAVASVGVESIYWVFLFQALFSLAVESTLFKIFNTIRLASTASRVNSLSI